MAVSCPQRVLVQEDSTGVITWPLCWFMHCIMLAVLTSSVLGGDRRPKRKQSKCCFCEGVCIFELTVSVSTNFLSHKSVLSKLSTQILLQRAVCRRLWQANRLENFIHLPNEVMNCNIRVYHFHVNLQLGYTVPMCYKAGA